MGFFISIFPKQTDFYELLNSQSQKVLEGISLLEEFMKTNDITIGKSVIRVEEETDELRRIIIDELDKTFITPFEREDIFNLSGAIDDIVDYARSTVEEMEIYELDATEDLLEIVTVLVEATQKVNSSIRYLKNHRNIAVESAVQAKSLENKAETLYRIKLAKLVKEENVCFVFKMRDVYRHLSNLADKIDLAANIIGHIIVKRV